MKLNKYIIGLYVLGVIAGVFLFLLPFILGDVESKILNFMGFISGLVVALICLVLLDKYISKRKRPDLLRRKQIEFKDERNTIIREKAANKALAYLWFMLLISLFIYEWFDIGLEYTQLVFWFLLINSVIYFTYSQYYKKRL